MNKILTHAAIGVAALGLGGTAGYLIGKSRANKLADIRIKEVDDYWLSRTLAEDPAGTPIFDEAIFAVSTETAAILEQAIRESVIESTSMFVNPVTDLEVDEDEIKPDFPEPQVEFTDEFTVDGEAPAIDARAFVEQFKNRTVDDFGGVTFPGSIDLEALDSDPADIVVRNAPDFVTVRDPNGPYVISIDEYMDPETDPPFTKVEMRWFAGDNVVVDARDDQVPMSTIGEQNTKRFGEGTTDASQVYIRNERIGIDIELTRESGLYLHEVLGQDFPDKTPVLKMRQGDDI